MHSRLPIFALFPLLLASCTDPESGKSRGPIVLGDSSTIVTETNAALLRDQVADLKPAATAAENGTATNARSDHDSATTTSAQAPASGQQPMTGDGLHVAFKEVNIFIPGITVREQSKNRGTAHSSSLTLSTGNLAGAQLRVGGTAQVKKVSQRYQTGLMLKDGNDNLVLESLPKYTSDWETLNGTGDAYTIMGLQGTDLEYRMPSPAALRNAVQQAARRQRLKRKDTQDWLDAVRNLRSANQAPAVVVLRSVTWRVEGKGFSKELRVDVPL